MKALLITLALMLSSTSFAKTIEKPCDFDDYRLILIALQEAVSIDGEEHADHLVELLREEVGARCVSILNLDYTFGIPGTRNYIFQIESARSGYDVRVTHSKVTGPKFRMSIDRLR